MTIRFLSQRDFNQPFKAISRRLLCQALWSSTLTTLSLASGFSNTDPRHAHMAVSGDGVGVAINQGHIYITQQSSPHPGDAFQKLIDDHIHHLYTLFTKHNVVSNGDQNVAQLPAGVDRAVLLIGPTGAGKSTFLNWIMGHPLVGELKEGCGDEYQMSGQLKEQGLPFHISHDGNTGTFFPNLLPYTIPLNGERIHFWDIPGLHSVDGSDHDIIKVLELAEIVKQYRHISVMLVIDQARCLMKRDDAIIRFLNHLTSLFPGNEPYLTVMMTQKTANKDPRLLFYKNYVNADNNLSQQMKNILNAVKEDVLYVHAPTDEGLLPQPDAEFIHQMMSCVARNKREHPVFRVTLNASQVALMTAYADKINGEIKAIFNDHDAVISRTIQMFLETFQGNVVELGDKITDLLTSLENFRTLDENEPGTWHVRPLLGLEARVCDHINLRLKSLANLKNLSESVRQLIKASPHKWIAPQSGLGDIVIRFKSQRTLNQPCIRLVESKVDVLSAQKVYQHHTFLVDILTPSITVQTKTEGTITLIDQDDQLSTQQIYTFPALPRTGQQWFPMIDTETLTVIPYAYQGIKAQYMKGSLQRSGGSEGFVQLKVDTSYTRIGAKNIYTKTHMVDRQPLALSTHYTHDDAALQSAVLLRGSCVYNTLSIPLSIPVQEASTPIAYPMIKKEHTVVDKSFHVHHNHMAFHLTITHHYQRPDQSLYKVDESLTHYPLTLDVASGKVSYAYENHLFDLPTDREAYYRLAQAYDRKQEESVKRLAFAWYKHAAQQNHQPSVIKVIDGYIAGIGNVDALHPEAIEWYKQGMQIPHPPAIIQLATCYVDNISGLSANSVQAITVYKKAMAIGHERSLFKLVDCYISKVGGLRSESAEALQYYQHAATVQYIKAQLQLGKMYHQGLGVNKDYNEAKRWYQMAAHQGDPEAIRILQSGVLEGPVVPAMARGHADVYQRFINGKLIFDNEKGQRREFEFRQFANTLEGELDLTGLTYTYNNKTYNVSDDLRIKIGFRSAKENESKVTCWLTPKFLLDQVSSHPWKNVKWNSPMGIFWTYGNFDMDSFDYLTSQQFDEISSQNLLKLWRRWCEWCVAWGGHVC